MALFILNKKTKTYEQAKAPVQPAPVLKGGSNPRYVAAKAQADAAQAYSKKVGSPLGIAKETGKEVAKNLLEYIPKTAVSLYETPGTFKRGTAKQKTYNVGLGNFKSYQSEAEDTAGDIIEGKKPLYSALKPFVELPLNFLPLGRGGAAQKLQLGTSIGKDLPAPGLGSIQKLQRGVPYAKSVPQALAQKSGKVKGGIIPEHTVDLGTFRTGFEQETVSKLQSKGMNPDVVHLGNGSTQVKLRLPEQTGVTLKEAAKKQRGFAETVSKSLLTDPRTKKLLQDSQYTPQPNDEIVKHANILINTDIDKATEIALRSEDNLGVATASELIKHFQNQGNFTAAANMAKEVATKLTEAGRTVQAASLYNKLTPEGLTRFAQNELAKEGLELRPDQAQLLYKLAIEANSTTGEAKVIATTKMLNQVQEFIPSKFIDQLATTWKAGLLTNPTTHIANVLGNTTMTGLETAKDFPAVLLDKFASVFTGKRTKSLPSAGAMVQGVGSGAKKAFTFMRTGVDVDQTLGKIDYKQVNLPPVIKQYTQAVFRTLGATDKVFKETLLKKSLHELAVVDGMNQGLKGKQLAEFVVDRYANPTIPMVEQATQDALYGTFNSENVLASALGKLKHSDSAVTRGLTELVAPFGRTPANIAGRIFDYSPVGVGKGIVQGFQGNQRAAVESIARGITGTGIIGAGYGLGKSGQMTGNYPTNPTEQALWQATGKQPGALNVGGNWQSLNRISPVGNLMSLGSGLASMGRMKPEDVPAAALGTVGKNLLSQTYLQGLSGALNAFQDPKRYGENWAKSLGQSVVPSVIGAVARATDPLQRQTNSLGDAVKARIPGLREGLLPKLDVFGNKLQQESNPLINPFNTTKAKDTPVTDEIGRLYQLYAGATLDHPNKSVSLGQGLKIELTPTEYTAYEQRTGGAFSKILDTIIKNPEYKNASDYDKAQTLNKVISSVRQLWTVQNAASLENKGSVLNQLQEQAKLRQPFYTK